MHTPSLLTFPAGASRWYRPVRPRRGTVRLGARQLSVADRTQLSDLGYSDWGRRTALHRGTLRRVVHCWYAFADADPRVTRPLLEGYRLTCIDAAELHGLWVPHEEPDASGTAEDSDPLHVYRGAGARQVPTEMIDHPSRGRAWPESDAVASLPLALEHALRCRSGETAAILLESAIDRRLLTPAEVQRLVESAPENVRSRIGPLSSASESGSETRVVRWLRRRGYAVEQQVFVEGAGYVDAYVAGLFLEIDGRTHHESPEAFNRDRNRDLMARRHGLQVLRLSYQQVWKDWEATQEHVLRTIAEVGAFGRRKMMRLASR